MATRKTALDAPSTPGHLAGEADYPALGSAECAVSEDESVDWVRVVPLSTGCAVTAGLEAVRTSSFCMIFESADSMVDMRVSIVEAVVRSSVSATEVEAGGKMQCLPRERPWRWQPTEPRGCQNWPWGAGMWKSSLGQTSTNQFRVPLSIVGQVPRQW